MTPHPIEILLVDDNDDDILMIKRSFRKAKILNAINAVHDGDEALAYLRREAPYAHASTPGIVLLDINMPRRNGFEVLEIMKADESLRHLPVIMLTTSEREEDIIKSYAEGAATYIAKPANSEKLLEVVRQFSLYWSLVAKLPGEMASPDPTHKE